MKTLNRNLIISALAAFIMGGVAQAKDRYLVVYKSQQGFAAMNEYMTTTRSNNGIVLEKSLPYINTMVINSTNAQALQTLASHPDVAVIEAEKFFPSPKPTNGFKLGRVVRTWNQTPSAPSPAGVPVFAQGPSTPWGVVAVKAPDAWALSQAGANAHVLILDTGIDQNHPALKQNFEQGQNFFLNMDKPDPQNIVDTEGHGTHVSGTIGGVYNPQTGFTGVAPLVHLLMGRVCGDLGCSNVAVAAGINWGIQQKVDVISMSLGGPASTPAENSAVAAAEKAGVVVVAASGNDGAEKVSFPAALPTAVAVGAVDDTLTKASFSNWGPELAIVAPGVSVVSSVPQGTGRTSVLDLTVNGVTSRVNSAAFSGTKLQVAPKVGDLVPAGLGSTDDFAKVNVAGKVALIQRGTISFQEKVTNALNAKAIGVVIYNNAPGLMQGAVTTDGSEIDAAVVMIEQSVGQGLVTQITGGAQASAAVSTTPADYAMYDGTSMATPHVTGVVALIKSANKNLTPAQVRTILNTTAKPLSPNDQNQYGAGFVQADAAVRMAVGQ